MLNFPSRDYIYSEPYGSVLIITPPPRVMATIARHDPSSGPLPSSRRTKALKREV